MARTQSKLYPEIRQGILKSAANLFAEKGFSTTTIVDLAAACQSSRGALYHYFSSKEEILTQILEEHVSSMLDVLVELGEERLEPDAHLRAVARTMMRINSENQSEQIVLLNDWNQLDEKKRQDIGAMQRRIISIIRDILARLDQQHRLTPRLATSYAMSLLGSINYTYAWFDPKGPVSAEEYADQVVDVFLHGFLSKPE
ncbi:HTH-type transcriptional repressor KstR2 (plasmid) [Sulfitobacter sp. THAF37]|uniref:TetR/AcrR family transcriptional regulator n=1 Tax=Sulfitobacter sp. THAF37 TaxID=2587855 RepID=UPI0012684354|nr:TetR/AcrR family transcriptional regulator [Sulfitobacter sp. THAF37]QFT61048.1 HTH-type transcriptional repressor KstR2 [Sulfitobacter sp. THAF37]